MILLRQFILRTLAKERLRVAVSILGIALGVAVVLAIQMANRASLLGFATAVEALSGKAGLEIISSGMGLDEDLLTSLTWLNTYGELSPVIEGEGEFVGPKGAPESLRILGVDILHDRSFREYRLLEFEAQRRDPTTEEFLRLLLDPQSVVITEKFASRYGLTVGSSLDLTIRDQNQKFVVRGLLRDEGPARAVDGNFLLMDIAAAQWAFDRLGRIDRLEILPYTKFSSSELIKKISNKLPPGWIIQLPSRRGEQVEKMLEAFHFNLTALSYISMLVGLFLIYNTISISVISRRQEIGILRALGTSRSTVMLLFLAEAGLIAICGCFTGLLMSRFLAELALKITGTTVKILYIATASKLPSLSWENVGLAFGMGLTLSLLAALVPSWEASTATPLSAIIAADRLETRFRLRKSHIFLPIVFFAFGAGLANIRPKGNIPVFGYLSAVAIVFGAAFMTPGFLYWLGRFGSIPLSKVFGVEGSLANANLKGAISRISVSVAALAVSLSMMTAIAIMIESFRETVIYWVGQTLQADLYVRPAGRSANGTETHLSRQLVTLFRDNPDVAAVDSFRSFTLPFGESAINLGSRDFEVLSNRGQLLIKEPQDDQEAVRSAIGQDAVIVSESFSLKYGKRVGNELKLTLPSGEMLFRVSAIFFDYTNDRGTVLMDSRSFTRHFGDIQPFSLAVYLHEGVSAEEARSRILTSLGNTYRVFIHTNSSLRREILRIFDSTFAITYALELISIFVAILGVASTLLTLILERRKDLAFLRLVGAEVSQIKKMVFIEALLLAGTSQAIGVLMGLALSWILINVINVQSFGWTIQFHFPSSFVVQSSLLILVAALLAGFVPAERAARLNTISELAEE